MSILVFKFITLIVRTIAKPLISWLTYYNRLKMKEQNAKFAFVKNRIINIGQLGNYYNIKINRKLFRLSSKEPIKPLTEEKAIEKGAEFLSEFIVYSILISLPVLEWYRQSLISKEIENQKEQEIKNIKSDLGELTKQNNVLREKLNELKFMMSEISNRI
jgi:hypothetical protein